MLAYCFFNFQGIARLCYAAPYGCPDVEESGEPGEREHLEQAKVLEED